MLDREEAVRRQAGNETGVKWLPSLLPMFVEVFINACFGHVAQSRINTGVS